jgi:hypothetical protein
VVFAASNLLFTVRFRLPTIIRYPSMWLLSSAILISALTGCACSIERMCDFKGKSGVEATMAHNTITELRRYGRLGVSSRTIRHRSLHCMIAG